MTILKTMKSLTLTIVLAICLSVPLHGNQTEKFEFDVTSRFGDRGVFEFKVAQPGVINAEATWSGDVQQLALILNGPGSTGAKARQDGTSPTRLSYTVTEGDVKAGDTWSITITNFSRKGRGKGTITLSFPAAEPLSTVSKMQKIKPAAGMQDIKGVSSTVKLQVKPRVYLQGIDLKRKYKPVRDYKQTKELVFVRHKGSKPNTYMNFTKRFKVGGPFITQEVKLEAIRKVGIQFYRLYTPEQYPNGKVVVAVATGLYSSISSALDRYIDDIATQGYYGLIQKVSSSGTPADLRNYLKGVSDIAGVVLVGDLPVAWYEHDQDFCGQGLPPTCHAEWPCDLFFMDLDGTWQDSDGDGIYDSHSGDTSPEIFLGRLAAYTLPGNETDLVNNYFEKNHRFRTGDAGFSARGVTFVDDDWAGYGKCSMDLYLNIVDSFTADNFTTAANYKEKLKLRLAWMQLCCHSWPGGHHFHKNNGQDDAGYVYSSDIKGSNLPQAFFHNLFCCSSGDFTENDYIAGWYTFGNSYGLSTVASSKTGSMLYFEYFYGAMGEGLTIGEALVGWWDAIQPIDANDRAWHYGMTIIGDPLLTWRVGAIPHSRKPADGSTVTLPGKITLSWSPITNFGSVKYKVEAHYWDSSAHRWVLAGGTDTNNSSITLNWGNKRYRWRVKVHIYGQWGPWSPWQYIQPA